MQFMLSGGVWQCQFLLDDLETPLRRKLTFQDPQKVIQTAKKGGADFTSADRQALEYGIEKGRGAIWLNLTAEQIGRSYSR